MEKALLLEPDKSNARKIKSSLRSAHFSVATITTCSELKTSVAEFQPDIVIFNVATANTTYVEVKQLLSEFPNIPVLFITKRATSEMTKWFGFPRVDIVGLPIKPNEVRYRTSRLLSTWREIRGTWQERRGTWREIAAHPEHAEPHKSTWQHLVPSIHNEESGRIDAAKVSDLFGIPLAQMAQIIGRNLSTIHKTPDADSLQPMLADFERIAAALLRLAGSPEGLRIWLNAPNPDIGGATPLATLKMGKRDVVANLLEDTLLGHPG